MGSERGQATVDYVAIVAVLAIVFSAALASAGIGAPGIVNAVAGQVRHALCLVGGGPCPQWRSKPCAVATTRKQRHLAVNLLVVRLDHDRYVLRETMSDGTVRLTVGRMSAGGVELGIGAHARAGNVGASDEARIAAQLAYGSGNVYVARDAREAARFMTAIADGRSPARPREDLHEGGPRGLATLGIGAAWLKALGGTLLGVKRDLRSGDVTLTLNANRSGWGAITAGLGPAVASDGATTFGLTLDRQRRPIELSVAATGSAAGGAALPLFVTRSLRSARANAGGMPGSLGGRRWELGARLDLRDPVVAAAWARFRDDPTSGDAIRALGAAIRDLAALDVRTYRTSSTSGGVAAGIAGGVRLGAEYEHTDDRSELIAASSRPSGGLWEPRIDCV